MRLELFDVSRRWPGQCTQSDDEVSFVNSGILFTLLFNSSALYYLQTPMRRYGHASTPPQFFPISGDRDVSLPLSLEWPVWSSSSGNNCRAIHMSLSSGASLWSGTFTLSHIISWAHLRDFLRLLTIGMCHFRYLRNGRCDRHRAEITIMQFISHSLPVDHFFLRHSEKFFYLVSYCEPSCILQIYIYIYIYTVSYSFVSVSLQLQPMVSRWSFSGSKRPQDFRYLLWILIDLNNAAVWMVSTCLLISKTFSPFTNSLGIVPSAPITTDITITFMCHSSLLSSKILVRNSLFAFIQYYSVVCRYGKVHNLAGSLFFFIIITRSSPLTKILWFHLYFKIPLNFVRLILLEIFCVEHMPFLCMFQFKLFA